MAAGVPLLRGLLTPLLPLSSVRLAVLLPSAALFSALLSPVLLTLLLLTVLLSTVLFLAVLSGLVLLAPAVLLLPAVARLRGLLAVPLTAGRPLAVLLPAGAAELLLAAPPLAALLATPTVALPASAVLLSLSPTLLPLAVLLPAGAAELLPPTALRLLVRPAVLSRSGFAAVLSSYRPARLLLPLRLLTTSFLPAAPLLLPAPSSVS